MTYEQKYKRHLVDQADRALMDAHCAVDQARKLAREVSPCTELDNVLQTAMVATSGYNVSMFLGYAPRDGAFFDQDQDQADQVQDQDQAALKHYHQIHDLLSAAMESDAVRFDEHQVYQDLADLLASVPR